MCGCDIHMFFEYTDKEILERERNGLLDESNKPFKAYWKCLGGRINLGRNYWMFGILSKGVRYDIDCGFEPKGIPEFEFLSSNVFHEYCMYITDMPNNDGYSCTMADAIKWATGEYCSSKLFYRYPNDDKPTWVSNPNWHSASWLTTEEYEKAIETYKNHYDKQFGNELTTSSLKSYDIPEYDAMLAAMKSLESNGKVCRAVFWFDN